MDENQRLVRPSFLPADLKWEELPEATQAAIHDIVIPLHRVYVWENTDLIQRSAGLSLVILSTMEILYGINDGQSVLDGPSSDEDIKRRQGEIDRYFRLVGAKSKCTELLLRLQSWREKSLLSYISPPIHRE